MSETVSMSWSDEASESFADRIANMDGWYVRLTTQDGQDIEAVIESKHSFDVLHGERDGWYDEVAYREADEFTGLAQDDAEVKVVRVSNVHVY